MELKMQPYALPEAPSFNYEELKAALMEKADLYAARVYTDEQITEAKADRAALNRLKKALNDERIKREREYMQPFAEFKAQIAEIIRIIDKPVAAIDAQVKEFEESKRAEKREEIMRFWRETGAPEWMHTIETSWLNASATMKYIQSEILVIKAQAEKDLAVIRYLPAYAFEAEECYKRTRSLAEAVREANKRREEDERKAAYEAERVATLREARKVEPVSVPDELPAEPKREWIAFQAYLTPDEARALGQYMKTNGIEYKAI